MRAQSSICWLAAYHSWCTRIYSTDDIDTNSAYQSWNHSRPSYEAFQRSWLIMYPWSEQLKHEGHQPILTWLASGTCSWFPAVCNLQIQHWRQMPLLISTNVVIFQEKGKTPPAKHVLNILSSKSIFALVQTSLLHWEYHLISALCLSFSYKTAYSCLPEELHYVLAC